MVDEAVAHDRAESGSVLPVWRECERDLTTRFQPRIDDVSTESTAALLAKQYRAGLARDPRESSRAGASPYEEPSEWWRTEVQIVVGSTGKILSARLVRPSGRARLDVAALDAVRAAVEAHPPSSGKRRTTARFGVESAVSVIPPEVDAFSLPGTTRPVGAVLKLGRVQFDETTGHVSKPDYLLKRVLRTRVTLLSVAPE